MLVMGACIPLARPGSDFYSEPQVNRFISGSNLFPICHRHRSSLRNRCIRSRIHPEDLDGSFYKTANRCKSPPSR
jgi:hypothetical protein